ncbi:hypothetical protein HaLaN_12723, partial [Haematococcus lacustris]
MRPAAPRSSEEHVCITIFTSWLLSAHGGAHP